MPDKKISKCKICGNIPTIGSRKLYSPEMHVSCGCGVDVVGRDERKAIDIWNKLNSTGIEIGDTIEINVAVYEYQAIQSVDEDSPIMIPDNEPLSKILPINCCSECGRAYDVKRTKT